jgi:hypothetical protein
MKNQVEIIVIAATVALVGVRLYQKFFKKNKGQPGQDVKAGSSFPPSLKEDDYEPYSKK